jgi:sec-independent protein translocase protein TatB
MLSIPHLVIIFLIALIVLGPEKLPQMARVLGKAMADFRRITTDFRVQIEDEMREMERHTRLQQQQQMTTAEASPFHPTDPELLGAVPSTSEGITPAPANPAPANPAEIPPPPAAFTGAPEPAMPEPAAPMVPAAEVLEPAAPGHAAPVTSPTANVPEKPFDGKSQSA